MPQIPRVMLMLENSRAYGRGLLRGIAKYSDLHGPWAFYEQAPFYINNHQKSRRTFQYLKQSGINGIITRDTKMTPQVVAMGLPTIITDLKQELSYSPVIKTDDVSIGKMGAEYFLDSGFKQFAYCGFDDMFWSRDRQRGFCERIKEAGFEVHFHEQPKSRARRSWEHEQDVIVGWLRSLPKPIGLMACNDDRGRQVIEACKAAGVHVPEQIALLGVDNDDLLCNLSNPRLSSIALNFEKAGYEGAALLDKLMAGTEKPADQQVIVHGTHIVTRQSTDVLAIEDSDVAEAVRFIREHAKDMIHVDDVVNSVAVSRRGLERRFRRILNRSVFSEIKRVRLEQVTRMLAETNQSIGQIAIALNFTGIEHISRFFRQTTGMSPLAYRKEYGSR